VFIPNQRSALRIGEGKFSEELWADMD